MLAEEAINSLGKDEIREPRGTLKGSRGAHVGERGQRRDKELAVNWSVSTKGENATHQGAQMAQQQPKFWQCCGAPVGRLVPHGLMSGASLPACHVPHASSGNRALLGAKCYHYDQPQPRGPAA